MSSVLTDSIHHSDELRSIGETFKISGTFIEAHAFGNGLINQTYLTSYNLGSTTKRYILQRINHQIFRDPVSLMENVERVCNHMQSRLQKEGSSPHCLDLVSTKSGGSLQHHANGTYWRCFHFIEDCTSYEVIESPEQAYQASRKFGEFQRLVSDMNGERLAETIPDFHNTPKRLQRLIETIEQDPLNRAAGCAKEIEFVISHQAVAHHLLNLHRDGLIPERVTHNDTKLSNVLINDHTGEGVCVVDLDTVMPGLSLYDFGDLMRSCISPLPEDSTDLENIRVRLPIFKALARGFLEEMAGVLTPSETANLAFAGKLLTYEVAIRFLDDYLQGDTYFSIKQPKHNLDRTRNQLDLVKRIEAAEPEMNTYVEQLVGNTCNKSHRLAY